MRVNITAGEWLNEQLESKYPGERFVPFNESMIQGTYSSPLFSEEFVRERANVHGVSETAYLEKLSGFLDVLNHAGEYDEIVLWFGDEPFCVQNRSSFPDGYSAMMLVGARLRHISTTKWGTRQYMNTCKLYEVGVQ